jgi:type IV pilus assembly protein PilB
MHPRGLRRADSDDPSDRFRLYEIAGVGRFRVNAHFQRKSVAIAIRTINDKVRQIEQLFLPEICAKLTHLPRGLVLVTGPTGSGKTTTLYCALNFINSLEKNIMTIEDPVEYEIPLIRQAQINTKAGLTFAAGLRAFLRQDPDVILVGEIRDGETAEMSLRAALTGHLVLSTIHTNNAAGAIPRLIEMGQSPHILASSVILVVAQRLFRKICGNCKQTYVPDEWLLERLHLPSSKVQEYHRGRGCTECNNSGYRGRGALYELLKVTPEVQTLIVNRAPVQELVQLAQKQGMIPLHQDALGKVLAGVTTIEEAIKVTHEDF